MGPATAPTPRASCCSQPRDAGRYSGFGAEPGALRPPPGGRTGRELRGDQAEGAGPKPRPRLRPRQAEPAASQPFAPGGLAGPGALTGERRQHAAEAGEGAAPEDLPGPDAADRAGALPAAQRALQQPALPAARRLPQR